MRNHSVIKKNNGAAAIAVTILRKITAVTFLFAWYLHTEKESLKTKLHLDSDLEFEL